jgi:hypothetical protein
MSTKKFIQIPLQVLTDIVNRELTRNQIIYLVAYLSDDDILLERVYNHIYKYDADKYVRYPKDTEVLTERYGDIIDVRKSIRSTIDILKQKAKTETAPRNKRYAKTDPNKQVKELLSVPSNRYAKIKYSTFYLISGLEGKDNFNCRELRVIFWLIKEYLITYHREREFSITKVVNEIFNPSNNKIRYSRILLDTLEKLKHLQYTDDDIFVRSYDVKNNILSINLNKKGK